MMASPIDIQDLHQNEIRHFEREAARNSHLRVTPVDIRPVISPDRRPWNSLWSLYDLLLDRDIAGKSVLVAGCGYGDDAFRLAYLGGNVNAFDISPTTAVIADARCQTLPCSRVTVTVAAIESMPYPDNAFDIVVVNLVLHHCALAPALAEIVRVAKPDAEIFIREPYMRKFFQGIRGSHLIKNVLYPKIIPWLYGQETFQVSPDEHPLDENDVTSIKIAIPGCSIIYFNGLSGRIAPDSFARLGRLERSLYHRAPWIGAWMAAAILCHGRPGAIAAPSIAAPDRARAPTWGGPLAQAPPATGDDRPPGVNQSRGNPMDARPVSLHSNRTSQPLMEDGSWVRFPRN